MTYLFDVWEELTLKLGERELALFLDYDGTLTPIVDRPERARLPRAHRKILRDLSDEDEMTLFIVSGRSLSDLKKRVRLPNLVYVGNHGFELEGPRLHHVHPGAEDARRLLRKISSRLRRIYRFFPGILIENKTFTVGIHYREAEPEKVGLAKAILLEEIGAYLVKTRVILAEGKKVWEIRPAVKWNKGRTVLWLLARHLAAASRPLLPVYIGDDVTDEDAFGAIRNRGLAVKVTEDPRELTEAAYYLRSPAEVIEFLRRLKTFKRREKSSAGTRARQGV